MSECSLVVIASPIVDCVTKVSKVFLRKHKLPEGVLYVPDNPDVVSAVIEDLPNRQLCSGGSGANTCNGLGMLGVDVTFMGCMGADSNGDFFAKNLLASKCKNACVTVPDPTTCIYCLVSEGGVRTMLQLVGASSKFDSTHVDAKAISASNFVFIDSYQMDYATNCQAVNYAFDLANNSNVTTVLTTSDINCVKYYLGNIMNILPKVDVLFGNKEELLVLLGDVSEDDWQQQIRNKLLKRQRLVVVTLNDKGSLIFSRDMSDPIYIYPVPVNKVVDQTGAGDGYAAGFLYGLVSNFSLDKCGKLGSAYASQVIQQVGACLSLEKAMYVKTMV